MKTNTESGEMEYISSSLWTQAMIKIAHKEEKDKQTNDSDKLRS